MDDIMPIFIFVIGENKSRDLWRERRGLARYRLEQCMTIDQLISTDLARCRLTFGYVTDDVHGCLYRAHARE